MDGEKKNKVGIGVGVMIVKNNKVLLGKRHLSHEIAGSELRGEGSWTFPGGKLEYGESFEEAAIREAMEETGIKINSVKVIGVNNDKNEFAHYATIGLLAEDFSGEAKIMEPNKITEWKWFDIDELPSPMYFPSKKLIENYNKKEFYIKEINEREESNERNDKVDYEIIEKVRKFVEEECKKPSSRYGYEPYECHFIPVVKYAKILAEKSNADKEVVEIAAWLHDIGSIIEGRENHHITGTEIAEKKLKDIGYPDDKIEKVKHCIYSHRGSQNIKRESIEAQILADADSMSNFENITGIFKAAFVFENNHQDQARASVLKKLTNNYNKLSYEAKEIIKPKFEAVKLLLE